VRAAYGQRSGWHGIAKATGHARISARGVEKGVAVTEADASVLDQLDAAYREKYGSHYAAIVEPSSATVRASAIIRP
jgi:hypothetical protein